MIQCRFANSCWFNDKETAEEQEHIVFQIANKPLFELLACLLNVCGSVTRGGVYNQF